MCFPSPECGAPGAPVPGGGVQSSATAAAVRGVDSGVRPGPAPAWGSSPRVCVAGLSSRGLENGGLFEFSL